ncbi:unnamed protein product [Orchesella dallaii]|uniref:Uncharacterized protein n=1 Tax=Orchesella dallaii TaxID=48710 RepID=A0ABP1RED2_9HEXA
MSNLPPLQENPLPVEEEPWYTDPQTFEEKLKFVSYTRKYMAQNAKLSKKDFIKFVNFYNENMPTLGLPKQETEALAELHAMWKKVNEVTPLKDFVKMKQQHAILNKKLMGWTPDSQPCAEWLEYVVNFESWHTASTFHLHKALQLYESL